LAYDFLRRTALAVFLAAAAMPPAATLAQIDPEIADWGDPAKLEAAIATYNAWPDAQQARAVGGVIGQMAGMFRLYPERLDAWLAVIDDDRIETFATFALTFAGDPRRAVEFAAERGIGTDNVLSVLFFSGGEQFPDTAGLAPDISPSEIFDELGPLETMPQNLGWHQDVLWGAALAMRDGKIAARILARMDGLFDTYGIEAGTVPLQERLDAGEFDAARAVIAAREGRAAASGYVYGLNYAAAGGRLFAFGGRPPFIAEAFDAYAGDHPDSEAVKEVLLHGEPR